MHDRVRRAGGRPRSKPSKRWMVSALNAWPLSVRSAISVWTPGKSSGLRSTLRTRIAVGDEMGNGVPAGLAGSAGEDDAFAGHGVVLRERRGAHHSAGGAAVEGTPAALRGGFTPADGRRGRPRAAARCRRRYRPGSSTARRGRAGPGWCAGRRRGPSRWVAKEWRSACGVALSGRPSAPRIRSIASCTIRGESGPPLAPTNSGPSALERVGAEGEIVFDRLAHRRDDRRGAGLWPLPTTVTASPSPTGASARLRPSASEMRRPAP